MSITKPFTFMAGTKARANEVNADFDTLYTQVNSNISAINTNTNDIDNLESTKANINGSTSQVFKVANPAVAMDAVNKQTMMGAISNSINYIDGYIISKDSGSPEDTILVSVGSCYDSSKTVVLAKDTSTTKQNTSQGASVAYYVYVIGSDNGSSVDILISDLSVTPLLPEGYTKFRQIGSYTTDGDNKIDEIYYYGINSDSDKSVTGIINSCMPDWSRKVSKTAGTSYTADKNGWVNIKGSTPNAECGLKVNDNIAVSIAATGGQDHGEATFMCPVAKGDTYTTFGTNSYIQIFNFIPCKGEV